MTANSKRSQVRLFPQMFRLTCLRRLTALTQLRCDLTEKLSGPRSNLIVNLKNVQMLHHRVMHWFDLRQVTTLTLEGIVWHQITQRQLPSLTELTVVETRPVEDSLLQQLTSLTVICGAYDKRLLNCTRLVRLRCDMLTILPSAPAPLFSAGSLQHLALYHTFRKHDELDSVWQLYTYVVQTNVKELYLRFYYSRKLAQQLQVIIEGLRCISHRSFYSDYDHSLTEMVAHVNLHRDT